MTMDQTQNRNAHIFGLLATLAMQLAGVWGSSDTELAAKIAMSAAAALAVFLPSPYQRKVYPVLLACIPLAVVVLATFKAKVTPGSATFGVLSILPAVLVRLGALLPVNPADAADAKDPPTFPPAAAVLALFAGLGVLGYGLPARADIDLNDLAPKLTKCWGATCIQPAASVNAVLFDLSAKKWQAGTTSLGAGLELLFAADQAYSSGLIAHLTGVISQTGGQTFAMPTVGVVLLRYAEIGYSYRLSSDSPNASYVSVALTLPWDLVATGKSLPVRAAQARAVAKIEPGDHLTVGDF